MENSDYLNLNVKLLKLFLLVLDSQSVSKAAEELDLNQSTVSYSLDKLRDVLGDPLFVKHGRGIVPTERAERIAPRIREVLLELESLATTDQYVPHEDNTEITIATNVMELLPHCEAIHRHLRASAPNVLIRFLELGSRANIRQLLETQATNLVISVRPTDMPDALASAPLFSFKQVCFYDPDQRGPVTSVAEFCDAGHATLDFGGTSKSTIDYTLEALSMSRNVVLKAPNIAALAQFMKGTDLITTMQIDLARHAMHDFGYCKPPIVIPPVNFDLLWHRRSQHSAKNAWLRSAVRHALSQAMTVPLKNRVRDSDPLKPATVAPPL